MISAVVLTKNEEKNIKDCLKSLAWCDEIIIVDDYSEDKTVKKCRMLKPPLGDSFGMAECQIYQRHLGGDFASQRNFGLKKAKGEWVLFVDADERISPELQKEIIKVTSCQIAKYSGFYLKRWDFFGGRWLKHGETGNVKLLRLAKKEAGIWKRKVHEFWEIKGKVGELKHPLLHYPHQTIREFIKDIDFFSTLHAKELAREEKKPSLFKIIFYPAGKFLKNYFFLLGFLDGIPGLIVALMMSFHSFLSWSKFYLEWKK